MRISGVRGEPAPPTVKVCLNYLGGYRNQMTFVLTGLDIDEKAYMGVASRKTGALFEWAGAVLSELSPFPHEQADPPRLACAAGRLSDRLSLKHFSLIDIETRTVAA